MPRGTVVRRRLATVGAMTETTTTLMLQLVADPRPRGTAAYEAQLEVAEQFQGALQALGKLREIEASGSRF